MSALRRTLKLTIEYDGTDFAGFQRQTGQRSVQAVLEEALGTHLREEITVVAAGRTDAGVHAAGQVVSFRTTSAMPLRGVVFGTNGILPADVAVLSAEEVTPSFHARRDAMRKHYRYRVLVRPVRSPLLSRVAHRIAGPLDVPADGRGGVPPRGPPRLLLVPERRVIHGRRGADALASST